jgi:hypothetical protein
MPPAKGAAYTIFVPKTDAERKKSAMRRAPLSIALFSHGSLSSIRRVPVTT